MEDYLWIEIPGILLQWRREDAVEKLTAWNIRYWHTFEAETKERFLDDLHVRAYGKKHNPPKDYSFDQARIDALIERLQGGAGR